MMILKKLNKENNIYILIYTNMKKIWLLTTLLFGSFLLAGCNNTVNNPEIAVEDDCVLGDNNVCSVSVEEPEVSDIKNDNSLVIVFSPTGHTKQIATYISEIEGSDLNELIPEIPYTAEDLDYNTNGTRANNEQNDPDARREIATEFSLDGYDRIYIGYPIWWWTNPKIILTLIEKYDFSGKEIVLFCTSWSSGIGTSESELRGHGLNIIWSKRFAQGASKQEVQEWLESL